MLKILKWTVLFLFCIGLAAAYFGYQKIYKPNINPDALGYDLQIPTYSKFDDVVALLGEKKIVSDIGSFKLVSKLMKYDQGTVAPGNYVIDSTWNNKGLVSRLRSGNQTPVKLVINSLRLLEELSGRIGKYIEPDSVEILSHLQDSSAMADLGYSPESILSIFIPNTYEFWWTTSVDDLMTRMKEEHDKFWNDSRLKKAEQISLTPSEVYTLASIVEKETRVRSEKPRVAGVYLNRVEKGMLLQADPTVVFAHREFGLKRILKKHLKIDSPYNTYIYEGLPPGPICMPGISSIDGVLDREEHKYLYFCAKDDYSGKHAFARSLKEHNNNARAYWRFLKNEGIR